MKSLLISIKPKWVVKILNKEKTIEVRKNKALAKAIQKLIDENGYAEIYVYCTKDKKEHLIIDIDNCVGINPVPYCYGDEELNGKVAFKFRCYKVEEIKYHFGYYDMGEWTESYILEKSCLSAEELDNYLQASKDYDETKVNGVYGYAIHISNLEIFDKQKELGEFKFSKKVHKCDACLLNPLCVGICVKETYSTIKTSLTKAPQNYCFIEVEE